jgi:hypothetical protein
LMSPPGDVCRQMFYWHCKTNIKKSWHKLRNQSLVPRNYQNHFFNNCKSERKRHHLGNVDNIWNVKVFLT